MSGKTIHTVQSDQPNFMPGPMKVTGLNRLVKSAICILFCDLGLRINISVKWIVFKG